MSRRITENHRVRVAVEHRLRLTGVEERPGRRWRQARGHMEERHDINVSRLSWNLLNEAAGQPLEPLDDSVVPQHIAVCREPKQYLDAPLRGCESLNHLVPLGSIRGTVVSRNRVRCVRRDESFSVVVWHSLHRSPMSTQPRRAQPVQRLASYRTSRSGLNGSSLTHSPSRRLTLSVEDGEHRVLQLPVRLPGRRVPRARRETPVQVPHGLLQLGFDFFQALRQRRLAT